MKGLLIYDGISSANYDASVSAYSTLKKPERYVETVSVDGRNGDLIIDHGRYNNVEITYKIFIGRNFKANYESFINFLLSKKGYKRLEDTIQGDIYRMAMVSGEIEPDAGRWARVGSFDITFNCKPQCFLKSGELTQTFTADGSIYNPTIFEARPMLRVYGTGTFSVGGQQITINEADEYTDFDCDIDSAYKGAVNCNSNITAVNYEFPRLSPGENTVSLGSGITKIEITPRWFRL